MLLAAGAIVFSPAIMVVDALASRRRVSHGSGGVLTIAGAFIPQPWGSVVMITSLTVAPIVRLCSGICVRADRRGSAQSAACSIGAPPAWSWRREPTVRATTFRDLANYLILLAHRRT